jgi:beta-lactam-binding protein with PASTA domain
LVLLWRSQLSVGEVVEEFSEKGPSGTVLRQSHVAGTLVAAGTKITIYVASDTGRRE